jgi:hypothetical protein
VAARDPVDLLAGAVGVEQQLTNGCKLRVLGIVGPDE